MLTGEKCFSVRFFHRLGKLNEMVENDGQSPLLFRRLYTSRASTQLLEKSGNDHIRSSFCVFDQKRLENRLIGKQSLSTKLIVVQTLVSA